MENLDLNALRKEIDVMNDEMLDLFLKRMEICGKIAQYKAENGLPILNKGREREILAEVASKSGDMELYAHRFFANMMEISRAYQAELTGRNTGLSKAIEESRLPADAVFPRSGTVGISGVEGAYAQEAADRMFPRGSLMFFKSFSSVFEALNSGLCEYAVVPIENSTYGTVKDVYNLLQEHEVYITRTTRVNIQHELLAKPGTKLSDIKEIYSHEQAIGQCDKFLKSLPDDVNVIKVPNTAMAAKMVAESDRTDVAAIASHDAGQLYALKTVKSGIMDSANNYTRFASIRKTPAVYPGATRMSLILTTEHKPGALYDLLSVITALGINMCKLESAPLVGSDFESVFYMDLETSVWEPGVLEMLNYLERSCDNFKYLGNYPEA